MRRKLKARNKIPNYNVKKILVPLDGSKNSLRAFYQAVSIARKLHAKIAGIYVIPMDVSAMPLTEMFQPLSSINPFGYKEKKTKEGEAIMSFAKEQCKNNKVGFTGKVLFGNPGDTIVKFTKKRNEKFDWIIMGSRGMGHPKEFFLGSISHYVVHKSKIPVLIVK